MVAIQDEVEEALAAVGSRYDKSMFLIYFYQEKKVQEESICWIIL